MMMLVAFVLLLASVPLSGGRLSALARLRFRWTWLLPVALALQVLVTSILPRDWPSGALAAVHAGSYLFIAGFFVANRRTRGLWVAGLGMSFNLAAIAANGGVMPASAAAQATAGIHRARGEFANSASVDHPRLLFLGDVFAVPRSWPLSNVFSVGDALIVVGAGLTIHLACRSRGFRRPDGGTWAS